MTNCTLHAGTVYQIEIWEGSASVLSPEYVLGQDEEVRMLASGPNYRVYEGSDGVYMYVRPENDVNPIQES